jgi:hypothetical protein
MACAAQPCTCASDALERAELTLRRLRRCMSPPSLITSAVRACSRILRTAHCLLLTPEAARLEQ